MNEKKIDIIDYIVALVYVGVGGFIWLVYKYSFLPQDQINGIMAITFIGPISLFLMYYKRFRIMSVTLLWLCIGILQLISVYQLKDNPDFKAVNGTYADNYMNLLLMVVLITLFRIISLVTTRQEFVVAAWFSPKDNRKLNVLDYILSFIGFLTLTIGVTLK